MRTGTKDGVIALRLQTGAGFGTALSLLMAAARGIKQA
jgi:hypothetical protein